MSLLETDDAARACERATTSANGAMRAPRSLQHLIGLGSPFEPGTTSKVLGPEEWGGLQLGSLPTTSGCPLVVFRQQIRRDSGAAIFELRRLSGLTWEQLARLFRVAPRSLRSWASGKPLDAPDEEHLDRTLSTIRAIDRGSASENRMLLLGEHEGRVLLELLAEREYEEVVERVGGGPGRELRNLLPLSREEQAARTPLPPEVLTGALQDRVHEERGRSQPAASSGPKRER